MSGGSKFNDFSENQITKLFILKVKCGFRDSSFSVNVLKLSTKLAARMKCKM